MSELKEKNKNHILSYPDLDIDSQTDSSAIQYIAKPHKSRAHKVFMISAYITIALLLIFAAITFSNLSSDKIFGKVSVDNIDIGGLTKQEAIEKLQKQKNDISAYKIKVVCENITSEISGQDLDAKSNIESAVDEAYSIGRYSNIISNNYNMIVASLSKKTINSTFEYSSEKLNDFISSVNSQIEQPETAGYTLKDGNLIIKKGKTGIVVNSELAIPEITKAIQYGSKDSINLQVSIVTPESLKLSDIKSEVYKEAKNATYEKEPFKIIPHQVGVDFAISLEEAQKLVDESTDECVIPLKYTNPKVTTDNIGTEAFPDLLASFQTTYIQSKVNRTVNLKLASNSVNGAIVMPGETFSYNKTLGPRTVEAGYKMAGVYSGGEVVDGLGGGICQISSTLYNIVLLANLDIIERHNHQFLPGYVIAGRDATVVWGALDFKFKNNRNYPVKIVSSVSNGYVYMKLYGVKEANDYEVVISTTINSTIYPQTVYENTTTLAEGQTKVKDNGENGCKSVTYKILKQNGKEVSRVQLSSDTYSAMKKVILRGVKTSTTPPTNESPVNTNTEVATNTINNNTVSNSTNNNTSNTSNN